MRRSLFATLSLAATTLAFATYSVNAQATMQPASAGAVITADVPITGSEDFDPLRLLAYSINDGTRAAGDEMGFFVGTRDAAAGIVEGEDQAHVLKMFGTGEGTVTFVSGADSTEGPRFLIADEDGARFDPVPTDGSYFFVRQPLQSDAAAQGFISLESQLYPGQYLRHSGFRLMLDPIDANSPSLDRRDATFLALADGAEIPVIGGGTVDVLATTVTEFGTNRQIDIQTAIYETLETNFFSLERTETIDISLIVTILTSLYEVGEDIATTAVLTVFQSQNVTTITDAVSVAAMIEVVQTSSMTAGGYYLASHFEALASIDLGMCGIEEGGFGGFGDRAVPTNSHGDVHIFTPDGLTYDLQVGGEFTLVASQDGQVAVHTRQTVHVNDPSVSSNTAVALQVGTDVLEFYSDRDGQRFYINGVDHPLATTDFDLEGGGYVLFDGQGKSGPRYVVGWPDEAFQARVNLYAEFLNVGVAGMKGSYSGLIGNLDGNPLNDMMPRGGASLICPPADAGFLTYFADSWRLSTQETLLQSELDVNLQVLVTESETGTLVSAETALFDLMQANFVEIDSSQSVDVSSIVSMFATSYGVSEEVALETVVSVFQDRGVTSVTDVISIDSMVDVVEIYEERREIRTLDAIDIQIRARAQRICQAGGIDDPLALANCTLDVATTQEETYVESAVSFSETIVELPAERRQTGSTVFNPLAPEAILPPAQVIEIVGPPEVVPSFEELVTIVRNVTEVVTVDERIVTQVTSDITSTFNPAACSEVEGLRSPTEVLQEQPQAGGVAIFCATHARGQTVTVELGRTLDDAVARAELSCPTEAESRIEDLGEVVIGCREIGRAEREFDFGGGVLSVGRDVTITVIEQRVTKTEVPEGFGLVLDPVPGLTAQCMEGETVPLDGVTVEAGLLSYVEGIESDFQNLCSEISLEETEDDYLLQTICFNEDASDAATSAISLLGVAAIEALIEHPNCAPVVEGPFLALSEDGLETDIPDRGDFVLIRNAEAGIEVHARRDLWVSDQSESVFTALVLVIGSDIMEVFATPEPTITVNGLPFEDAGEPDDDALLLPGGGRITVEGTNTLVVTWPNTTFAMQLAIYPGSHISPAIQVDTAYSYEGLVRFTQDWILEDGASVFSVPLGADPTCDCAQ